MKVYNESELRNFKNYRVNMNFTGADFTGFHLQGLKFDNCVFNEVDLTKADLSHTWFEGCVFCRSKMIYTNLEAANLRYCDLSNADISGANLHLALLEYAILDNIKSDETTKFFRLYCPEEGPFIAYKKCFNDLIVQLLVAKDALRTSATGPTCRCSKAKVLSIKSVDGRNTYSEAISLVDENFIYRVGEWVEVKDFNPDRWIDSTKGIHIWMTREEAIRY